MQGTAWDGSQNEVLRTIRIQEDNDDPDVPIVTKSMLVEMNADYCHASMVILDDNHEIRSSVDLHVRDGVPQLEVYYADGTSVTTMEMRNGKWEFVAVQAKVE